MRYYFAPMEGLTDLVYRRLHHKYFPGVHRYFTPFFSPTVHRALTPREAKELPAADTLGCFTVPQILSKVPADFIWMSQQCKDLGYTEVNLNLGCPSGTVTAKGKGSGMLRDLEALDRFLEAIFAESALPISIKTRIGFSSDREFEAILDIYNRYPVRELTVHPRIREDFYKGPVSMKAYAHANAHCAAPLCYNGDIRNRSQIAAIQERYPRTEAVMVGRGLVANPGMFTPGGTTAAALEGFMQELFDEYYRTFGSARNTMFRMKEHWGMLIHRFDHNEKLAKRLRKTTDVQEFRGITAELLHSHPLLPL